METIDLNLLCESGDFQLKGLEFSVVCIRNMEGAQQLRFCYRSSLLLNNVEFNYLIGLFLGKKILIYNEIMYRTTGYGWIVDVL